MSINSKDYRVREGSAVDLKKWPTRVERVYRNDDEYQAMLKDHVKKLSAQQELLYASGTYAVLLIFQAMDAAGKDGVIEHVMSGVNPQGCQVFSFKHPSATELKHDFLWRTTVCLPERGKIGIFNRSYYEEVLIVRVHPEILRAEGIPGAPDGGDKSIWQERFRSILGLERHLETTARVSSSSSCISRKRSSASDSSRASMRRKKTGSSARRTSKSGNTGSST